MLAATTVAMLEMGQTAAAAICGIGTVTIVLLIGAVGSQGDHGLRRASSLVPLGVRLSGRVVLGAC
jgi:hypothetical protein